MYVVALVGTEFHSRVVFTGMKAGVAGRWVGAVGKWVGVVGRWVEVAGR